MNNSTSRQIVGVLCAALFVLGLTGLDFGAGLAAQGPRAQTLELGPSSVTVSVTYLDNQTTAWGWPVEYDCGTWPSEAKTAFQYAVSIWASLITSSVPVEIEACWANMGGALGLGAPAAYQYNFAGAPVFGTWYPNALANKLAGIDLDSNYHDINVVFNSDLADWYFGTDGDPGPDEYDFVTAVLQQLGHGLGFIGSMNVSGGVGSWGGGTDYPFIYDRFTENGFGQSLINDFANNSSELADQLQSANVYFDGPSTRLANGGSPAELYAPFAWASGSSYNHLDDLTYDKTENALMAPTLDKGEVNHHPGPVTLGIFQDMGWDTVQIAPDLTMVKQVVGNPSPEPGDPVTFTLSIENIGAAAASGVVVTDTLSTDILTPTSTNSFGVTPREGTTYVWDLPDLSVGESGVITVSGTISPTLPPDYAIFNTAIISTDDEESNSDNNRSTAVIGGRRVYLPAILKNSQ